jgi:hypothetical protein
LLRLLQLDPEHGLFLQELVLFGCWYKLQEEAVVLIMQVVVVQVARLKLKIFQ